MRGTKLVLVIGMLGLDGGQLTLSPLRQCLSAPVIILGESRVERKLYFPVTPPYLLLYLGKIGNGSVSIMAFSLILDVSITSRSS